MGVIFRTLIPALACIFSWSGSAIPSDAGERRAYVNRFWQTSEGLPSNVVNDIAVDRDGFIWMGTGAGVARFDGAKFDLFDTENGLPDTQIHSLHLDRTNRPWVGTRRGAAYYEAGRWVKVAGIPNASVFSLGESGDGSIWAGSYAGCWRVSPGLTVTQIDLGDNPPDVRGFLDDGDGGLWILTQSRLCRWRPENPGQAEPVEGPWNGRDLRGITSDKNGRLIVCGTELVVRQAADGWEDLTRLVPGGPANAHLSCIVDETGTLWLATRNRGLVFWREDEEGVIDVSRELSLDDVRCLAVDRDGMLWAGTNGGGVNRLRLRPFDAFTTAEGLGRTVTSALVEDYSGRLWAGTDGAGIHLLENGRFIPKFEELPDKLIWSMSVQADGALWVGTYKEGLFRIRNGRIEPVPLPKDCEGLTISALAETRDGGMLVGIHDRGVLKWRNGRFDTQLRKPEIEFFPIHDLLEDNAGRIWKATGGHGLWMFDGIDWREMSPELGLPGLLPTLLHQSDNGDLWIGTLGQGLIRVGRTGVTRWTKDDGLVSDTICQMLEDHVGHLWLGTDRGLQRISISDLDSYLQGSRGLPVDSIRFGRADGLPTPQFSAEHGNLATRTRDGKLWFSLASGAIRVDPDKISKAENLPFVRIENATSEKNGRIWNFESPGSEEGIIVSPGSGTLQIRFTSPSFVTPERTRFQFRMTGLENGWHEVEGARTASYASLPPGHYRFEVITASYEGTWNPRPASVNVIVQPYFWQTLGFRLLVSVLALATITVLIRKWSLRRLRRRLRLLKQERRLENERARIARDLHDDLGASLTEINFLGTLASDAIPDSGTRKKIDGMVERAQRMAKSLDEIVWTVNPANDSLSSTASYLCSRTQESLSAAGIRCRLDVDDQFPSITLDSELRHHLLMAVNEIVNNIMKHSNASECTLSVHSDGERLSVVIADNGTGFDPARNPDGRNGLINLGKRMEAAGGHRTIATSVGKGTIVTLRIPLPGKQPPRKGGSKIR